MRPGTGLGWRVVWGAIALALAAQAPAHAQERVDSAARGNDSATSALDRRPTDLPRAAIGRWSGLYTEQGLSTAVLESLPRAVFEGMQAAERTYSARRYPEALANLYAVLEVAPDFPPALLLLGNTHYRVRRYRDSADALERYIVHAPAQLFRTQALGHDLYTLGDYPAALAHYERVRAALVAAGHGPGANLVRGIALCHMRLGEADVALRGLDEVLERDPGDAEALVWRAQILLDLDRLEEAVRAAARARDAAPYEPRPWFLLSQALAWSGLEERAAEARARWKAIDGLTQALRQAEATLLYEPRNYGAALRAFDLEAQLGNGPAAVAAFERARALRPSEVPDVLLLVHGLGALTGVDEPALAAPLAADLEACAENLAPAWEVLAEFYASIGREADAARARRRAGG